MLLSNLSKIKASYKNRNTKYRVVLKYGLSVYIILLIVNQLCNLSRNIFIHIKWFLNVKSILHYTDKIPVICFGRIKNS